jgi:hypothetical protein
LASTPGFGRRCRFASAFAAPASSLDFLQGTFEKICFENLLAEHTLKFADLFSQLSLARVRRRAGPIFDWLHLVAPLVQLSSMNP